MTQNTLHQQYFYKGLSQRYLNPAHLKKALDELVSTSDFERSLAGYSSLGREIEALKWGKGAKRIMLWAQMHGNETTATQALLDFLQYLKDLGKAYANQVQLLILPQLNPDGAQAFTRRNAQGIDINRDAVARQSPEMQVFQKELAAFQPHWCFNLHDQRSLFSVGEPPAPATLSFLAASADAQRTVTPVRQKAMQMIDQLHQRLEPELPGQFGRYTDEFYPKALGDNLHAAGIPCILLESGAHFDDPHRETARKLNFLSLVHFLELLNTGQWKNGSVEGYEAIPANQMRMRDWILRHCTLPAATGSSARVDLALTLVEEVLECEYQRYWELNDLGDLSQLKGLREQEGGLLQVSGELAVNQKAHFVVLQNNQPVISFKNGQCNTFSP